MKRRLDKIAQTSAKLHTTASCSDDTDGEEWFEVIQGSAVPDGANGMLDDAEQGASCFSLAGVMPACCAGQQPSCPGSLDIQMTQPTLDTFNTFAYPV